MKKKVIALNSLVSGLNFIIGAATIFILFKYVLKTCGDSHLGVWSLILSFSSLSGMSTSVIAGGVIKFVAKYEALEEREKVISVINTNFISFFILISIAILIGYPILNHLMPSIFELKYLDLAKQLLPISFLAFFANSLAQVYLLSLDGLQLYYISQSIKMLGRIIYLVATILLIPSMDILGMAYGYLIYNAFLFIAAKVMLHIQLPKLSILPTRFSKPLFMEMLNYGWKFQITSFAQMTIMPTTKMLLKSFGSLAFVAYFEMAFQLVTTLKGGMSAISAVFTPVYASLVEKNAERISQLYFQILKVSSLFAALFFPLLFLALPFISHVWIGEVNSIFIQSSLLLGIAYMMGTLAEPQYILNLGSGNLIPNMVTMILASLFTLILGGAIGYFLNGIGVLMGYTLAFIIANVYLILSTDFEKSKLKKNIINLENIALIIIGAMILCLQSMDINIGLDQHILSLISAFIFVGISLLILISQGVHKEYLSYLKK